MPRAKLPVSRSGFASARGRNRRFFGLLAKLATDRPTSAVRAGGRSRLARFGKGRRADGLASRWLRMSLS
eukprot:14411189-Alexandrium_andersonii.AAC.1